MIHALAELQTLFDFTADDLAANRTGRLSDRQRQRIERDSLRASIDMAAASLALPVIPALTIIYLWIAFNFADALGPWTLALIAAWLGTMWLAATLVFRAARWLLCRSAQNRDHWLLRRLGRLKDQRDRLMRAGQVERLTGRLRVADDGEHTSVQIGDQELMNSAAADVDDRLWQVEPERAYTVYLLPELRWVLAIEPLADA